MLILLKPVSVVSKICTAFFSAQMINILGEFEHTKNEI